MSMRKVCITFLLILLSIQLFSQGKDEFIHSRASVEYTVQDAAFGFYRYVHKQYTSFPNRLPPFTYQLVEMNYTTDGSYEGQ
ncbi:hypothetical protein R9C00_09820 [Flammeovirgaceae bacterium SG7u.111]|nr:hypothetical protein [Flammeovirgaceae bacterium SG7u.132]WPO37748.1 hypothetical protein R9C00_09820 [Flammeovirgaceae bacterium SG7u.111]